MSPASEEGAGSAEMVSRVDHGKAGGNMGGVVDIMVEDVVVSWENTRGRDSHEERQGLTAEWMRTSGADEGGSWKRLEGANNIGNPHFK